MPKTFFIFKTEDQGDDMFPVAVHEGDIGSARAVLLDAKFTDGIYRVFEDTSGLVVKKTPPAPKAVLEFETVRKRPRKPKDAPDIFDGIKIDMPGGHELLWNEVSELLDGIKNQKAADVEVSAATGGKYQRRRDLEGAPPDALKQVIRHLRSIEVGK